MSIKYNFMPSLSSDNINHPTYYYYLGPHEWRKDYEDDIYMYYPPSGTVGSIDLRKREDLSTIEKPTNCLFIASTKQLDRSYGYLGQGDCREILSSKTLLDTWEAFTGKRPDGETLVDILYNHLVYESDIDGASTCSPLIPTTDNNLEVYLGGHSLIKREKFRYGRHPYSSKLRDICQMQYTTFEDEVSKGYLPQDCHDKILDYWLDKYKMRKSLWKDFVPNRLKNKTYGPVKHSTTITESWNGSDSRTFGVDLSWTEWLGGGNFDFWHTRDNKGSGNDSLHSHDHPVRCDSNLSSDDHYIESSGKCTNDDVGNWLSPCTRFSSSAQTYYRWRLRSATRGHYYDKVVSGSVTNIGGKILNTTFSAGTWYLLKHKSDGSSHECWLDGTSKRTETDTSITGNVRVGYAMQRAVWVDDMEAADLAPPTTPVTGSGQIPYSNILSLSETFETPSDNLSDISEDLQLPYSYNLDVVSSPIIPYSNKADINITPTVPLSFKLDVSRNRVVPISYLQGLAKTAQTPISFSAQLSSSQSLPVDWGIVLLSTSSIIFSNLLDISTSEVIPYSYLRDENLVHSFQELPIDFLSDISSKGTLVIGIDWWIYVSPDGIWTLSTRGKTWTLDSRTKDWVLDERTKIWTPSNR